MGLYSLYLGCNVSGQHICTTQVLIRSHVGIYIGHSTFHAGLVALVLKSETGHVSTQFHVAFDD